jgi:predicted protein tyrosine phosphatase
MSVANEPPSEVYVTTLSLEQIQWEELRLSFEDLEAESKNKQFDFIPLNLVELRKLFSTHKKPPEGFEQIRSNLQKLLDEARLSLSQIRMCGTLIGRMNPSKGEYFCKDPMRTQRALNLMKSFESLLRTYDENEAEIALDPVIASEQVVQNNKPLLFIRGQSEVIEALEKGEKWDVIVSILSPGMYEKSTAKTALFRSRLKLRCAKQFFLALDFDDIESIVGSDSFPPTTEHISRLLELAGAVEEAKLNGSLVQPKILVHCQAGISRSTASAIVMLTKWGYTKQDATNFVMNIRPYAMPNKLVLNLLDASEKQQVAD